MHLSRLPDMAELVVAMFAPELEGSLREPPPEKVVLTNLIDHLACDGFLSNMQQLLKDMVAVKATRNEVALLLHQAATAMERTTEILRSRLNTPAIFVSPPGMMYWTRALQQFTYILTNVCLARQKGVSISVRWARRFASCRASVFGHHFLHFAVNRT